MEKTLGHKIYDRYIKLYTPELLLPNGAKHYTGDMETWHTKYNVNFKYSGELRPYQTEGLMHIVENKGGLIEASTGSGKSHLIISVAQYYKKRTLIVTPTKKLVKEMVDKFKEFTDYVPGTWYSDGKNIKEITITTHTSFVQDMLGEKKLGKFDVLIIDECDDHLSEKMIQSICYSDCNILVGLSGTTDRQELNLDDMQLIFGPHVCIGDYQVLPDEIIHYVYKRSPQEAETIDYTNRHYQRESILHNKFRFDAVVETIKEIRKESFLSLLLLDRIEEIQKYSEVFPEAIVITGNTKVENDCAGIAALSESGGLIIGSIKKMYRGIDIPPCDSVIIASPIRFENTVIQAIGRALRPYPTKKGIKINIINDDVLQNQRREQTKACRSEYGVEPKILYIKGNIGQEKL